MINRTLAVASLASCTLAFAIIGRADAQPVVPSGSPTPSASAAATASATTPSATTPSATTPAANSPAASSPASTPASTPSSRPSSTPTAGATPSQPPVTGPAVTLAISAVGSPQPGKYFSDLGAFHFTGSVPGRSPGQRVEIWRSVDAKSWSRDRSIVTGADRRFASDVPVTAPAASLQFRATLGGRPGAAAVTSSAAVSVSVLTSTISVDSVPAKINALSTPTISGRVYPARAGVKVNVDAQHRSGKFSAAAHAVTGADGRWKVKFGYDRGHLQHYTIRAAYKAANRDRWQRSGTRKFTRVAVLDAKIAKTTAADVAKTYRPGCPVGPSKLRTITLNYYGLSDHLMHRGVIIIRADLADDLVRAFGAALKKRYPIAKMNNPNVYGGNDPKQMEADNTSGFNCRKVTGNPYAQSPHSYGTALDVNTVENPYRDVHGKWWPKNGKKYIDRSPLKPAMLSKNSTLTKSLRKDRFFWGGFWNPGRDYQHFQR